jgi:CCR4-NOT transcriptional regulation complex NOT5 subunit
MSCQRLKNQNDDFIFDVDSSMTHTFVHMWIAPWSVFLTELDSLTFIFLTLGDFRQILEREKWKKKNIWREIKWERVYYRREIETNVGKVREVFPP